MPIPDILLSAIHLLSAISLRPFSTTIQIMSLPIATDVDKPKSSRSPTRTASPPRRTWPAHRVNGCRRPRVPPCYLRVLGARPTAPAALDRHETRVTFARRGGDRFGIVGVILRAEALAERRHDLIGNS